MLFEDTFMYQKYTFLKFEETVYYNKLEKLKSLQLQKTDVDS